MSTFKYRLLTTSGGGIVEGEKEALNKVDLIADLRRSGHIVLSVHQVDKNKRTGFFLYRSNRKAILPFTQELAILLEAGIPIDKSLSILLSSRHNNPIKDVIGDVLNRIKSGKSFAEALANHVRLFSVVYINMVRAGEEGGVLPQVLKRLGGYQEKVQKIRGEIISAMVYPFLLSFTGIISISALVVYVIPKFSLVFEGMGIDLPLSTRFLISFSHYAIRYGWVLVIVAAAAFFFYRNIMKDKKMSAKVDQKKLKIPVIGDLIWEVQISRFARTLGTLLENGVSLLKSIDIVKDVLSNRYLSGILGDVKGSVKEGAGLTASLAKRGFLPEIAVHLLKVGEETGNLDKMLLRIADNFDADIEQRMKRLVTAVEPALILCMGIIVGTIVVSMLTAILSINNVQF
ncbi:MAG: type II secretion system F family protein [Candidatus Loosdrechtia sp.]|uniref:type II secretion system F family protein n=1 Tax=Candidatus Loosdrechtia sp. TaxID=3101272 RepID=UPI003A6BCFD9|nr:MAG: type II secretion system F family protein [Candidatus Jettenia sp. AMX2]